MTEAAIACAALRAVPLCLLVPFPTVWARLALAIVLAIVGASITGDATHAVPLRELGRGLALGLGAALPVYAARATGAVLGHVAARRDPGLARLATVLGWLIFLAAGGGSTLVGGYLRSYARWPVGAAAGVDVDALVRTGVDWFALTAQLALPILALTALVEVCAALLSRFEDSAAFELGAAGLARAARPVLVVVLFAASLAAFTHGIGAAVLAPGR